MYSYTDVDECIVQFCMVHSKILKDNIVDKVLFYFFMLISKGHYNLVIIQPKVILVSGSGMRDDGIDLMFSYH